MDNHMKGSEQPTSETNYKSPHTQFGQNDNWPKKIIKSIKLEKRTLHENRTK